MNILIIEDNLYKSDKIRTFMNEIFSDPTITLAHSVSSGIKILNSEKFDLAIIDMSLPTFDKTQGQPPSNPKVFGGLEIAKHIHRKKSKIKYIILTQYKSFAEDDKRYDLTSIKNIFKEKYINNALGCVFYENSSLNWKKEIINILDLE